MTNFTAIIYTSKNGHTKRYAEMLGQITGKPVFALNSVSSSLPDGSTVIYLGWIHASNIKGYKQTAKHFSVPVVCGVGLCDTGTLIAEVRKVTSIPDDVSLFTLQGGMDRSKLKGMDKLLISMLIKGLESKKDRSEQDNRMLELLKNDTDCVFHRILTPLLHSIFYAVQPMCLMDLPREYSTRKAKTVLCSTVWQICFLQSSMP